jgi:geranylgeranyl reductase family protein
MMNRNYDTIIIGAGPAGSTAARFLAAGGNRVLLIEKKKMPRYKVCGGGLVWRARKALATSIKPVIEREFHEIHWKFRDDMNFTVKRPYPLITMVMRDKFDAFLAEEAVNSGAELHDEEEFTEYNIMPDGYVKVSTNKETYRGNHLLAADGLRSTVLRQSGYIDKRIKIPAIEAEITVDNPHQFDEVVFDVQAIDHGYAWIFPKAHHLSVGIAAMPQKNSGLKKRFEEYLTSCGLINHIQTNRQYGFQIPLRPHKKVNLDKVLLLGDAAGLADPLVAEGISHAIFSGLWAAEAILNQPAAAGMAYSKIIKKRLKGQIGAARLFAGLFYEHPGICRMILRSKGDYITDYVTDIFSGKRTYPDNPAMLIKAAKHLVF